MEFITNIYHYLETLYQLNQKIVKLSGADAIRNMDESISISLSVCDDIPRLIPYICKKGTEDELTITDNNGLMEFSNEISFLTTDYNEIIIKHCNILNSIRKIRNKYEHKMHTIKFESSSSGSSESFCIKFNVKDETVSIYCDELINLVKDLNILFSKIVSVIGKETLNDKHAETLFNEKLITFDYKDFNKLYECEYIKTIGKLMFKF